jgi:hypothetical protein
MKPERQPSTGLSIALKSTDLNHISNSSCLVLKETEFLLYPKKIDIFVFLGHTTVPVIFQLQFKFHLDSLNNRNGQLSKNKVTKYQNLVFLFINIYILR